MAEVALRCPGSFSALIERCGEDLPLELGAAYVAAEEQPGIDPFAILAELDSLGQRLRLPPGAGLVERVARLNHLLHVELGLQGDVDTYDDPRNSLLDQVLERRKGLPILLCVIAIAVGRRAGLTLAGIAVPSHFLVSPADAVPRFYLDPFHGGDVLREEHLERRLSAMFGGGPVGAERFARYTRPASPRQILVRLNNNLKGSYLRRTDLAGVLRCIDRMLLLDPGLLPERRDRGWVLARLDRVPEAIDELESYLVACPCARDAQMVRDHLDELRTRMAG